MTRPKPQTVSVRVTVPAALFEKICAYRHQARHESRRSAITSILTTGLTVLTRPPDPPSEPARSEPRKLVPYAGKEPDGRASVS